MYSITKMPHQYIKFCGLARQYIIETFEITTVVPVMNGHPRDQAKVSVHCRWPLIRGTDWHVKMSRDIDNVAVHSRWPLTTGVAQGRYCRQYNYTKCDTMKVFFDRISKKGVSAN